MDTPLFNNGKPYEACRCGKLPKFFCEAFSIRPIYACLKPKTEEDFEEENQKQVRNQNR